MTTMKAGPRPEEIKTCKCGASIMFLKTKKGSRMPVNVMPTSKNFRAPNSGETDYVYGQHESHFATCPEADDFRSGR